MAFSSLGARLATSRLFGHFGENNTMTESAIILLIALVGFALLILPQRLGLTGLPKKLLLVLVYALIAIVLILQIFVFP